MPNTNLIAKAIRTHQIHLPEVGHWWRAIHQFTERTLDEFWHSHMPYPILSMDGSIEGLSCYDSQDTIGLRYRISLNPLRIRDGVQAAELLAHEMVHMHEDVTGVPTIFNVHTDTFHDLMFTVYGIATHGENGMHTGCGGKWEDWLEENLDLELARFKFGGEE